MCSGVYCCWWVCFLFDRLMVGRFLGKFELLYVWGGIVFIVIFSGVVYFNCVVGIGMVCFIFLFDKFDRKDYVVGIFLVLLDYFLWFVGWWKWLGFCNDMMWVMIFIVLVYVKVFSWDCIVGEGLIIDVFLYLCGECICVVVGVVIILDLVI